MLLCSIKNRVSSSAISLVYLLFSKSCNNCTYRAYLIANSPSSFNFATRLYPELSLKIPSLIKCIKARTTTIGTKFPKAYLHCREKYHVTMNVLSFIAYYTNEIKGVCFLDIATDSLTF